MDGRRRRACQLPQEGGAVVVERGRVAACEDSRHPPALLRQLQLSHGIDARIDPAQPSAGNPMPDRRIGESERQQLDARDDTVLLPRKHPGHSLASFGGHSSEKVANDRSFAPNPRRFAYAIAADSCAAAADSRAAAADSRAATRLPRG